MKRVDLSGFDAEFPPYKTKNPNEPTLGSKVEEISRDLKRIVQLMIDDDSDDIAQAAMAAKRAVDKLSHEMRTQVDEFSWYWEPSGE